MPVIVAPAHYDEWLDPGNGAVERLDRLLAPDESIAMTARNEGAALIEPVDDGSAPSTKASATDTGQGSLL